MNLSGAWRRWLRLPASPPESSRCAHNRFAPRRRPSDPDGIVSRFARRRGGSGIRPAVRRLRRGIVPALLCLPLLAGLAPEAAASDLKARLAGIWYGQWYGHYERLPEGPSILFPVQLSRNMRADETAEFDVTFGGTATRGTDYKLSCDANAGVTCRNLDSGSARITMVGAIINERFRRWGWIKPLLVFLRLTLVEDNSVESRETVTLGLGSNTFTVGIVDAPSSVTLSLRRRYADENKEEDRYAYWWAKVEPPAGRDVVVPLTVTGVTATAGQDFKSISSFTVPAGRSGVGFSIRIFEDKLREPDETFTVAIDTANLPSFVVPGFLPDPVVTIVDSTELTEADNPPTVVSLARTGAGAVVEGGKSSFTVRLDRRLMRGEIVDVPLSVSGTDVTVSDWSLSKQSGAANTGVTLLDAGTATPVVRFSFAGAQLAALELTAADDGQSETVETVTVALGSATAFDDPNLGTNVVDGAYPHRTANRFDVRVHDQGTVTAVTVSPGPSPVTEGGGASFTVTAVPPPDSNLTVNLTVADGPDSDVVASGDEGATQVVVPVSGSATYTYSTVDDGVDDGGGSVRVTVGDGSNYVVGSPGSAEVAVTDADPTVVSLAPTGVGVVVVGGSKSSFTVTLGRVLAAGEIVDVPLSVSGEGVTVSDWSLARQSGAANTGVTLSRTGTSTPVVRFAGAGAQLATLELTVADDGRDENLEAVTVALGSGAAFDDANLDTNVGGGADPHPTANRFDAGIVSFSSTTYVSFASDVYTVNEGDAVTPELVLSHARTEDVTVMVEALDLGQARSGEDFAAGPWSVTVPAGQIRQRFSVATFEDGKDEKQEKFLLHIAPYGHSDGVHTRTDDQLSAVVTIGPMPRVWFPVLRTRTNEGEGTQQVAVRLSSAPPSGLTLHYTVSGTATSGSDYEPLTGTLQVPAGTKTASIPVTVIDDSVEDSGETVTLTLVGRPGYMVESWPYRRHVLYIFNHESGDLAGRVQARLDTAVAGGDGASANLWRRALAAVRGETPPSGLEPLTEADAQAQASEHAGRGDSELATLWAEVAYAIGSGTTSPVPAQPEVTIAAGASPVTEGGDAVFTLTANPAPSGPLAVTVTVAADGDYGITAGEQTATIPTGGTYTLILPTTGDGAEEPDGSVSVTVKDGDGYTVGSAASDTVPIHDDDAPPPVPVTVSLAAEQTSVAEANGETKFTMTLSRALVAGETVTVPYAVSGGEPGAHWSVEFRSADNGSGVTRHGHGKNGSELRFSAGGQVATLVLIGRPTSDTLERTIRVAFGTGTRAPSATGIAGGIELGASSFEVVIIDDDAPPPVTEPAVTIAPGTSPVTEGGGAVFTLTANPAPSTPLAVTVTVTADGDYGITAGEQTVTIPTGGTYTLTLATTDDSTDEPDGSATVTVKDGDGYSVGSAATGTVAIHDDDGSPPVPVTLSLAAEQSSVAEANGETKFTMTLSRALVAGETVTVPYTVSGGEPGAHWSVEFRSADNGAGVTRHGHGKNGSELRFTADGQVATLVLIGRPTSDTAERTIRVAFGTGTRAPSATGIAGGIELGASSFEVVIIDDDAPPPVTEPAVTIAPGTSPVTEGADATFTITANPAPQAALQVAVTVAADGDYGITAGEQTVTIPTGGSTTLTLPTTDDATDEPNGSVSVTVKVGTGYTVGSPASGSVALHDDDAPPPVTGPAVTIVPGTSPVTEGGDAAFTLTANPAPSVPLAVTVTVTTDGDFGITGGEQTATIPTGGSFTLTLPTTDDSTDEPDGSVSVTVKDGSGYTPGSPASGTVAIQDDDEPAVTIAAVTSPVTEGGDATFTLTANPAPSALLAVTVTVTADGDYGMTAGERTVTIPTTGSVTLTLPTTDDTADEADGSVSVTVKGGTGYTVGSPASGTVAIRDDDEPAVTIAAGTSPVTEGTDATFTLTANPAPAADLAVTVTVTAAGDYGITAGERTVTIPTTGSVTLTLTTLDDTTDEADGTVTVTVKDGEGYSVGPSASGTVSIQDDDEPPPAITIAAKTALVPEGDDAVFTLSADRAPVADLAVRLTVSETAGSDHVAAEHEGAHTLTLRRGETSAELAVPTVNDTVDEPDGAVTARLEDGAGYTLGSASLAQVQVADDDATTGPALSIDDATGREGDLMMFTLRLSVASDRPVRVKVAARESVPVSARANVDFPLSRYLVDFRPGETVKERGIFIRDDSHDDGGETFEVYLYDAEGAPIADGVAVGTIENDDPLPAAWLKRFGRTVAEQALDGIAGRMAAPRTTGFEGTLAGQALSFDPNATSTTGPGGVQLGVTAALPADRQAALAMAGIARGLGGDAERSDLFDNGNPFGFDAPHGQSLAMQSRNMTAREALLGSSFSLTGGKDGSGGTLAFWGRAAQGSFDGKERGDGTDIRLDGTVTTGLLGADYAMNSWLVGLALAQSSAEGDFAAEGAPGCPDMDGDLGGGMPVLCDGGVRAGDGSIEASLTAAIPYAAVQTSERLKLWGAAGHGTGDVTLKTALGDSYSADTTWSMAAAGLRSDLLSTSAEGGPALALTSDALWARTTSEKTRDLAASESDVTRLRLGLEGSWHVPLDGGGAVTPKLETGIRHDGGDAERGFGVELGGGIAWSDPTLGLSLDLSGRTLLAHEDADFRDRGYAASLAFDPDTASGRGPSLSLRQDWGGQPAGGLDALFAPDPLNERNGSGEATSRWTAEAAYGLPILGGRFTGSPHVGFGLATGARDYSVGWRLTPEAATAPDLSFGLKATRMESGTAAPEHMVGFEASLRW